MLRGPSSARTTGPSCWRRWVRQVIRPARTRVAHRHAAAIAAILAALLVKRGERDSPGCFALRTALPGEPSPADSVLGHDGGCSLDGDG